MLRLDKIYCPNRDVNGGGFFSGSSGRERPMRSLEEEKKVKIDKKIGVYSGNRAYRFEDFDVLPIELFLNELHAGRIF
jgi:hypothetical protein